MRSWCCVGGGGNRGRPGRHAGRAPASFFLFPWTRPSPHPPSLPLSPTPSLAGRAAYYTGDNDAAAASFRAATALDRDALPAWEGAALVDAARGDHAAAARVYEDLVREKER